NATGAYILVGLTPADYDLTARSIGHTPEARRVTVLIGATLGADFALAAGAVELQAVTVTAGAPVIETKTSEVATNVTEPQINDLPTANRNIFDLAALAPRVSSQNDQINSTKRQFVAGAYVAAGTPAYAPDQVNFF